MAADLNWKSKYLAIRSKYMNDVDMAFRLGYEQGSHDSQAQQAQAAQNPDPGMGEISAGEEKVEPKPEGAPGAEGMEGGSELDTHINKLEGMLGDNKDPEIQKSLNALITLRKIEKAELELKKSANAIPGIVKNLHKPAFKLSANASHNLNDNAKKTNSLQNKIVTDIMQKWEEEENKGTKSIMELIETEGLLKS